MEEERRQAAAGLINVAAGVGQRDIGGGSCCSSCNLCGDVGFPEALLPCGARGCSRLQHTYCGRYCPAVVDDVKRWRCEWCALEEDKDKDDDDIDDCNQHRMDEEDDSGRKRSRRAPPHPSSGPINIKRAQAPRTTSPADTTHVCSVSVDRDKQSITGGSSSRALDRWKNLAKKTRLGGKKYKLLADVLC